MKKLLFFTYCNEPYFHYAAIYPLFALANNKNSIVEIGVSDLNKFLSVYSEISDFYEENFFGCVRYVEKKPLDGYCPGTLRFIYEPSFVAEYVYICDVDILILDKNICQQHVENMKKNNLDFSNIVRKKTNPPRLTGLHFIKYDYMYPLEKLKKMTHINDEAYLYLLMREKGLKIPDEELQFRPIHGIHCTPNRPFKEMPLSKKTYTPTKWGVGGSYKEFIDFSKGDYYKKFLNVLNPSANKHLPVIQLLQFVELACFYSAYKNK